MSLETGTYISDLVDTNPTGTDPKSEGDNHVRLLKSTIQNTFPNLDGAMTSAQAELNILDGATVSTTEVNYLTNCDPGTAVASTVLALGATKNIDTIDVAKDGLKIATVAITCTAAELNALDGIPATLTATELGYVDGVTSAIQAQIDLKAPIASPTLTGIPAVPTATTGTDTTQIATTAFVNATAMNAALPTQVDGYALTSDGVDATFNLLVDNITRNHLNLSDINSAEDARTNLDVYAKAETVAVANNLSDVVAATSRTNLDVYSKAESAANVGLQLLGTPIVASGASEVEFDALFTSAFDEYVIKAEYTGSTAATDINFTVKIGGSYVSATDYGDSYGTISFGGVFTTGAGNQIGTASKLYPQLNSATQVNLELNIHSPLATAAHKFSYDGQEMAPSATIGTRFIGTMYNRTAGALQAVKLTAAAGTITGTFRLYGVRNS
jgi:hypothetical protein